MALHTHDCSVTITRARDLSQWTDFLLVSLSLHVTMQYTANEMWQSSSLAEGPQQG